MDAETFRNIIVSSSKEDAIKLIETAFAALKVRQGGLPKGHRRCQSCASTSHEEYWRVSAVYGVESCPVCNKRQRV